MIVSPAPLQERHAPLGSLASGPRCPAPAAPQDRVQLGHGSGGRMSAQLMRDCFLPLLDNEHLRQLADAAVLPVATGRIAMSTDTFVVNPLEFPGGDIGRLAVHGTVNDLAMMGSTPAYLTAGFILEEGLPLEVLDRIVRSMAAAAREAGVPVVAGDTKVVERGKADGMFINTSGVGFMHPLFAPRPSRARAGDRVIASGPIGAHGIAIMAARGQLEFEADVESDTAALHRMVSSLRESVGDAVHVLRDPTRGGVASALNEIAASSRVGIALEEGSFVIPGAVSAACEMLGLDPLYVANEGVLMAIVDERAAEGALDAMRAHDVGRDAAIVGRVVDAHAGMVTMRTALGSTRVVDLLPGDQLPRIC